MTKHLKHFDVSVVGGGVVGLSAALGMAKRGYSVALIDAGKLTQALSSSKAMPDTKVFAINHASKQLLASLNVWQELDVNQISPYQHMMVWDAVSGGHIEFDARMIAQNTLGFIIEESVLRVALLKALSEQDNVHLFPEQTVERIQQEVESIELASSTGSWISQLLLLADGANSPCRALLKVPITTWPYHQHALVANVTTRLPHNNTAYQVFNPEGPLAFLPLLDPQLCSIVWSTTKARAEELCELSEEKFNEALRGAFADRLGEVSVCSKRQQFPLVMRHVQQYTGDHWVLLGDAAHTIHPLAGLGLNLGLADVSAWLDLLDKKPGPLPSKTERAAYQRQRKYAVWQVILLMQSVKAVFSSTWKPLGLLRGLGLQCSNQFSVLKRLLINYAGG